VHIAGPIDNGWRVVNVAPSQEEFEVFARQQLILASNGEGDPQPPVPFAPVYRLIRN
jgi:hypothetical protein